jgi:hypothetical protein
MSDMICGFYSSGVKGWLGKAAAKKAWGELESSSTFKPICQSVVGDSRRMMLHEVVRKVLGQDTPNYPQQVGDCVSFGAKNAIEYLMCTEILMQGDREKFRSIFPPYLYGTGRVQVGGGRISGDGSLGSWMAEAVVKYGTIASDEQGVPQYSGSVARQWGRPPGPPNQFLNVGKNHPVKSAARINNWNELVVAICNGYPCTVACNQGFSMSPGRDGFHAPSGTWAHQMCFIGVDDEHSDPYAIILNSWGDAHGRLKDFNTGEDLPIGVLRVRKRTVERMIAAQETFAFSNFEGFPEQPISKELFKLI